jgi:hypothetical protein
VDSAAGAGVSSRAVKVRTIKMPIRSFFIIFL